MKYGKFLIKSFNVEKFNISEQNKKLLTNLEMVRKSLSYKCFYNERDKKIIYKLSSSEYLEVFLIEKRITSVINHPKQGHTALTRQGLTDQEMLSILFNPRTHLSGKRRNIKSIKKKK